MSAADDGAGVVAVAEALDAACSNTLDVLDAIATEGERIAASADAMVVAVTVRQIADARRRHRLGSLLAALLWPDGRVRP